MFLGGGGGGAGKRGKRGRLFFEGFDIFWNTYFL